MKNAVLVACVAALSACATAPYQQHIIEPYKRSAEVVDGDYDATAALKSPEWGGGTHAGALAHSYRLVSTINKKSGEISHALVLNNLYADTRWRFWSSATTNKAESLPFIKLSSDVGACRPGLCNYAESVAGLVSEEIMQRSASEGLKVMFKAQSGSWYHAEVLPADVQAHISRFAEIAAKYRK